VVPSSDAATTSKSRAKLAEPTGDSKVVVDAKKPPLPVLVSVESAPKVPQTIIANKMPEVVTPSKFL